MTTEKLTKEELAEQKRQNAFAAVEDVLTRRDLYFVADMAKFLEYVPAISKWNYYSKEGLSGAEGAALRGEGMNILLNVLKGAGKTFGTRTYSFKQQHPDVLNQLRRDGWITPKAGKSDFHRFFEYLLYSLSGGKKENIIHIKRVIGRKFTKPEDFLLPCLCFYGAGGSGKSLLNEVIMKQIFGPNNVTKAKFNNIERFNNVIIGKTVVFFDEHPSREDQSSIKNLIGNESIQGEEKNMPQFTADNTPLYIIATNDENGPVRIENNGTERRFSFIKSELNLKQVIADGEGLSLEETAELMDYLNDEVWRNPEMIANFVADCIAESDAYDKPVRALHGTDFENLKDTQMDVVDHLCNDVLLAEGFQNICLPVFYEMYKIRTKKVNPGASPMSMQNFSSKAIAWVKRNKMIQMVEKARVKFGRDEAPRQTRVFYSEANTDTDWRADEPKHMLGEFQTVDRAK